MEVIITLFHNINRILSNIEFTEGMKIYELQNGMYDQDRLIYDIQEHIHLYTSAHDNVCVRMVSNRDASILRTLWPSHA